MLLVSCTPCVLLRRPVMAKDSQGSEQLGEKQGLRTGYTTGVCAAAATKAACLRLFGLAENIDRVEITLPNSDKIMIPVVETIKADDYAEASVRKDAGDDPDITDKALVVSKVALKGTDGVQVEAGEGVGTATKPGLAIPVGSPAINPTPRAMIEEAAREVTDKGLMVRISIPGGEELAKKTFNPRLGIIGGLSILGTSGIVRPFSLSAIQDSIKCAINVARAIRVDYPVFVPGRIGLKAAYSLLAIHRDRILEVGNEWGFSLDLAKNEKYSGLLVVGHPGKLAKLAAGWWDTHSSRSAPAVGYVEETAKKELGHSPEDCKTVEAIFKALDPMDSRKLGEVLGSAICSAVEKRVQGKFPCSVLLVDLSGNMLARSGDFTQWPLKSQ